MEYHEIHSFINQDKPRSFTTSTATSTINASTTTSGTTDGDSSSLGYSSDDSFDSYDTPLRQTSILEHQARRYYQLPVSPLPLKKQHWHHTPPHPPTGKHGTNSSLSKKFVQGVQSLKNKVAGFSPSGMSSTSDVSLASSVASDEYHSLGPSSAYGPSYDTAINVSQSEISTKTVTNNNNIPTHPHAPLAIDQETTSPSSPIPTPNQHTGSFLAAASASTPLPPDYLHPHFQHSLPPPTSPQRMQVISIQRHPVLSATLELLTNRTLPPSRLSSASKRSRVRKHLNSIWKRHLFKPASTPRPTRKRTTSSIITKTNHMTHNNKSDIISNLEDVWVTPGGHLGALPIPFEVSPDRSSLVSSLAPSYQHAHSGTTTRNPPSRTPAVVVAQVSEHIQKLQCLVDIEVQLVEDHQRDIDFYTNQLEQLNHDVQYLNHKVTMMLSNIENSMDPLQADIQRTVPMLVQLHRRHILTVTKFTNEVLRNRAKDTFNILQSKVKSAEEQLRRWDTITFWTTLISVIFMVCMFILWLIHSTGVIITSVLVLVLVSLFYDAS